MDKDAWVWVGWPAEDVGERSEGTVPSQEDSHSSEGFLRSAWMLG